MSRGAYVLGSVELIVLIAGIGFASYRLRALLVPGSARSPARLLEAVMGLSLFIVLAELVGMVGQLKEVPLLVGAILAAGGAELAFRRRETHLEGSGAPGASPGGLVAAGAVIGGLILARWLIPVQGFLDFGMWPFDGIAYHLPIAAGFAQSSSVTTIHPLDPVDLVWFYPANAELFHAAGIVLFDRDIISPLINLGWLSLGILALWCIGRPYGMGPASLAAGGIVLASPLLLTVQPGTAYNDIAGIALVLASAAILASAFPGEDADAERVAGPEIGMVLVAGLAAGLAIGTKLSVVIPVAGLSAGVVAIAWAGPLARVSMAWFLPMFCTGSYWYLRNLIATGNPLPFFDNLGPIDLPGPDRVVELPPDFDVAHYIGDGAVWRNYLHPGLVGSFGDLWWAILALALVGALGALLTRTAPMRRVLGATALLAAVGYLFTPVSAAGLEGSPTIFAANLRFLCPALVLGLALLPTLPWARTGPARVAVLGSVAVVLLFTAGLGISVHDDYLPWAVGIAVAVGLVAAAFAYAAGRINPAELALLLGMIAVLAIGLYWKPAGDYLDQRYTAVWPGRFVGKSFNWARDVSGARIGLGGTLAAFFQYPYYGNDVSNEVEYIGQRGPHGAFNPIEDCREWRETVNRGHYDYVITAPSFAPGTGGEEGFSPEHSWIEGDPAADEILVDGPTSVFRLSGPLDVNGCPPGAIRDQGLPPLLQHHGPA